MSEQLNMLDGLYESENNSNVLQTHLLKLKRELCYIIPRINDHWTYITMTATLDYLSILMDSKDKIVLDDVSDRFSDEKLLEQLKMINEMLYMVMKEVELDDFQNKVWFKIVNVIDGVYFDLEKEVIEKG